MTDKHWLELRPTSEKKLKKPNLETVVNFAFNRGEVVEFVVASTPSPRGGMDRNSVRWFFGFSNKHTRNDVKGHLAVRGFSAVNGENIKYGNEEARIHLDDLESDFSYAAELEATEHFAYGFLPRAGMPEEERTFEEYPPVADELASAIYPEGALKVAFKRDDGAVVEAIHKARSERGREDRPSFGLLDGFFQNLLGFGSKANWETKQNRSQSEQVISETEERMRRRAGTGLFTTDICIYGPPKQIESVLHSLRFSPVTLRVYRHDYTGGEEKFKPEFKSIRKRWRRTARKWSALLSFPCVLLLFWLSGLWDPLRVLTSFWHFLPLVVAATLPIAIYFFIRFKNPVVFSHDELTLFLSLPERIRNIPHEPAPVAEMPPKDLISKESESRGVEDVRLKEQGGDYHERRWVNE